MVKKVYLANTLFSESDVRQRLHELMEFKLNFPGLEIIGNHFEEKRDDKKIISPISTFNKDTKEIVNCDIFIADLTNFDPSIMVQLGIAIAIKTKHIICINSDKRLIDASNYDIPPYSIDHYVLGGILKYGKLVKSFKEALNEIEEIFKK